MRFFRKHPLALPLAFAVVGFAAILLPITGTVKIFRIPTRGMTPTIEPGDFVTAVRTFTPESAAKRGTLVAFDSSRASPRLKGKFIQRVAAVAGDTVDLIDGRLRVNGLPLPDRAGKVPRGAKSADSRFAAPAYPLIIPAGKIFLLGDNHDNSLDSRYFGPVPVDAVSHLPGRVIFPLHRAGKIE